MKTDSIKDLDSRLAKALNLPTASHKDWTLLGPLIEKYRIRLDCPWGDQFTACADHKRFLARQDCGVYWVSGPNPEVAIARCIIRIKEQK